MTKLKEELEEVVQANQQISILKSQLS